MWFLNRGLYCWDNGRSALNRNSLGEEWATVVYIQTCMKPNLKCLSNTQNKNFPSFLPLRLSLAVDTHLTGRKFLQCTSQPGLPVSPGSYSLCLCCTHTHKHTPQVHAIPICFAFPSPSCNIPQLCTKRKGGEVSLIAQARLRHSILDDRFVMTGWKSWAGLCCWVDCPLFATHALSNVVAVWIIWLF